MTQHFGSMMTVKDQDNIYKQTKWPAHFVARILIALQDHAIPYDGGAGTSKDVIPYDGGAGTSKDVIMRNLDRIISEAAAKYDEVDVEDLRGFVSDPAVLYIPRLPERLSAVFDAIHAFIGRLDHAGKSRIGVFHDGDSEDKLITTKWYVSASVDQCIKWTNEMVSAIIEMDEDMLDIIMVQVVPK